MEPMTLREIYQALGQGKKIRHKTWDAHKYIYLASMGVLIYDDGVHYENGFLCPASWELYEEPEDLDQKIKQLKYVLGSYLASGEVDKLIMIPTDIEQLIDLKIKQAKLR